MMEIKINAGHLNGLLKDKEITSCKNIKIARGAISGKVWPPQFSKWGKIKIKIKSFENQVLKLKIAGVGPVNAMGILISSLKEARQEISEAGIKDAVKIKRKLFQVFVTVDITELLNSVGAANWNFIAVEKIEIKGENLFIWWDFTI